MQCLQVDNLRGHKSDKRSPKDEFGSLLCRRRVTHGEGDRKKLISVRLADSNGQRSSASMLLNRMYSWRGYGSDHQLADKETCQTFTASSGGELIGTLTLNVDSPDGLAVDQTFGEELQAFRQTPGARLCELTKLAFDPSPNSRPVLASLFHIIFIYGSHRFNCTDLFIEVNPRHVRFYEVMLGFKRVGALKTNKSVDAPSQLMWLQVSEIRRMIDEQSGSDRVTSRSLYPYFFSKREERAIYARIAGLIPDKLSRLPARAPALAPSAIAPGFSLLDVAA